MKEKTKNFIISIGFIAILLVVFLLNIFLKDKEISKTERRKLAQVPQVTFDKVMSGDTMEDWDEYTEDQFIARDFFRSVKTVFSTKILKQKDNNGLFEKDGGIYKIEYPLNKRNVQKTADKINEVCEKYLQNMNVYYAIIPDKNYYLTDDDCLKMDYNALKLVMQNQLTDLQYIDIWDCLSLNDYYKTDAHWKQKNLTHVVSKLEESMELMNTSQIEYIKINKGNFYGGYYGQLGMDLEPDNLYILTNDMIDSCSTYNAETKQQGKIYTENQSSDKYDIFLYGATPIVHIENLNAESEKELLLFRDSYGSSLAPLLVENYRKITLIDLRYIDDELLNQHISFEKQDVLFLYSTLVINQSALK